MILYLFGETQLKRIGGKYFTTDDKGNHHSSHGSGREQAGTINNQQGSDYA